MDRVSLHVCFPNLFRLANDQHASVATFMSQRRWEGNFVCPVNSAIRIELQALPSMLHKVRLTTSKDSRMWK